MRAKPAAKIGGRPRFGSSSFRVRVLEEDFVAAHHPELAARALLERLAALLEVAHFGGERGVTRLELTVPVLLSGQVLFQLPRAHPAALSDPERILDEHDERAEDRREDLHPNRANASRPG